MAQPKETKRMLQVGELVKRNISYVFQQEGSYYYGSEALVTVTSVKMSSDMGIAKVYLSIYNTENKQAVLLEIEEYAHQIKQSFAQRVRKQMRRIPRLDFYEDETLDEMYRLNKVFGELKSNNQMGHHREEE